MTENLKIITTVKTMMLLKMMNTIMMSKMNKIYLVRMCYFFFFVLVFSQDIDFEVKMIQLDFFFLLIDEADDNLSWNQNFGSKRKRPHSNPLINESRRVKRSKQGYSNESMYGLIILPIFQILFSSRIRRIFICSFSFI
jgi:hypothetical protein